MTSSSRESGNAPSLSMDQATSAVKTCIESFPSLAVAILSSNSVRLAATMSWSEVAPAGAALAGAGVCPSGPGGGVVSGFPPGATDVRPDPDPCACRLHPGLDAA